MKLCKKCSKETYSTSSLCYSHLKEKEREKMKGYALKAIAKKKLPKVKKKKEPTELQKVEKLRKKCVLLAKEIAKKRDGGKCCYCNKSRPEVAIHSHHIYNEGCHRAMSADVDNLITVCFTHHSSSWNSKEPSFHKNPMEMADWFLEHYPERHNILKARSITYTKLDRIFWENKMVELKNIELNKICEEHEEENCLTCLTKPDFIVEDYNSDTNIVLEI